MSFDVWRQNVDYRQIIECQSLEPKVPRILTHFRVVVSGLENYVTYLCTLTWQLQNAWSEAPSTRGGHGDASCMRARLCGKPTLHERSQGDH